MNWIKLKKVFLFSHLSFSFFSFASVCLIEKLFEFNLNYNISEIESDLQLHAFVWRSEEEKKKINLIIKRAIYTIIKYGFLISAY